MRSHFRLSFSSNDSPSSSGGSRPRQLPAINEHQDKPIDFVEFVELYKAFSIRMRKGICNKCSRPASDVRDIFNRYATSTTDSSTAGVGTTGGSLRVKQSANEGSSIQNGQSPLLATVASNVQANYYDDASTNALTRNCSVRLPDKQAKVFNALASASVQVVIVVSACISA